MPPVLPSSLTMHRWMFPRLLVGTHHAICFDHQISDSTTDCRSHTMFAASLPPLLPRLLICLACRFFLHMQHFVGWHASPDEWGGRPLAPAAVFEYEWKQWKSSEAAGYNWYAIIHRWHQIHPPGTKEGKKIVALQKNNKCVNYQNSNKIICIVGVHHLIIKKNTNMTK